ncbi:hypothetical protein SASPL_114494 [Salvia splendens]|uniref:WD repeat-containing protein 55 n=1 Tax=Salvia splendens TaxID=180675 RepID=A0A8X8ZZE5_SALSN|nr:hypothetical protein SASPL_114494 [Salvia splendens]
MEIDLEKLPFDLDFHPSTNIVAAGLITGNLLLYRYDAEATPQRLLEVNAHTESCRALRFVNEGRAIVTGSPDCSILATDVETGAAIARLDNSHGAAVNRIVNLTESTIASGDDEGCIKVWDTRQRTCCNTLHVHEEYISDMTFASDSMKLIGTRYACMSVITNLSGEILPNVVCSEMWALKFINGDGTLSVCNLRSNKVCSFTFFQHFVILIASGCQCLYQLRLLNERIYVINVHQVQTRSEFSEDELLSVVIMKNGRKVVCGTQSGTLLLYSWGFFKDCSFLMISDRFVDLSPNSVDAMLKLDEDRLITGSENGIISLVGILPNRIIQPIAEHSEYPVEGLAFSHDKKFLGSISHDQTLKLWDLDELLQGSENSMPNHSAASDSDSDGMDVDASIPKPSKGTKRKNVSKGSKLDNSTNFFADM